LSRPVKDLLVEGKKYCSSCFDLKLLCDFPKHKQGRGGRRPDCKPCFGDYQYQKIMLREIEGGANNILECAECERYFRKHASSKLCLRCRRK